MWCGRRAALLVGGVLGAALACALVLWFEARRVAPAHAWPQLSVGLGIGSAAGVEHGFFAFDARLESWPESAFEPLPGAAIGASAGGAFTLAPLAR